MRDMNVSLKRVSRKYLDELFVPMAEYFISKGMYVVMRPPGVCPNREPADKYQGIEVGDTYQQFLLKVWDIVSQHSKLKNNTGIMFELANDRSIIKGTDGNYGSTGDACFANMKIYFQAIVDKIRSHCNNIIWVPGLAYQSSYAGYATHRIEGENIGFAVLCYRVGTVVMRSRIAVKKLALLQGEDTEAFQAWMGCAGRTSGCFCSYHGDGDRLGSPRKYGATWGKSVTGTAGSEGLMLTSSI